MRSALGEPIDELLLIDDVSSDETVGIARSLGDERVRVKTLVEHRTLGHARGIGLESLRSEYCLLLDADDAFLPGRVDRLVKIMMAEASDIIADEIELVDGGSGRFLRHLRISRFLDASPGLARLFERNYLPGIGQIAFRTEAMRAIGYDPQAHGTEDTDLVLRALASGLRFGLCREVGYRMQHFANSVSRNRTRQSSELARVLAKHDYDAVESLFRAQGALPVVTDWALLNFALFRKDYSIAASRLDEIRQRLSTGARPQEDDGPFPMSEEWRLSFYGGTIELLRKGAAGTAVNELKKAVEQDALPEAWNNLGVAYCRLSETEAALECFQKSVALRRDYADAKVNLKTKGEAGRVTIHPLRREASRSEYGEGVSADKAKA